MDADGSAHGTDVDGTQQQFMKETWRDWHVGVAKLLGLPRPMPALPEKLKVGTACSGTDAPVKGLHQGLGEQNVDHIFSIDKWRVAEEFICNNLPPKHFYKNVSVFSEPRGSPCSCCAIKECTAWMEPFDLLVMGFPCTPYSSLNMDRFADGYDPFSRKDAEPLFVLINALCDEMLKPRMVVLENVGGILQPLKGKVVETYPTPLDYLLDGASKHMFLGQRRRRVRGLKHIPGYKCCYHTLDARTSGLPHKRLRVFIILIRDDLFDVVGEIELQRLVNQIKMRPLTPCPLQSFLRDEIPMPAEHSAKKARTSRQGNNASATSMEVFATFRKKHGLPPMGSSSARPFTTSALGELLEQEEQT